MTANTIVYPTYPMLVRDVLMQHLQSLPFFTAHGFNFYTNRSMKVQPEHIPFAGVYFVEEINVPDGDANEGDVRFRCSARYGFSVIIQNNDADTAEKTLDHAMAAINEMFRDPSIYNWDGTFGPAKIQAFNRGARTHNFGSIGADNSMPIAELRFDLTCDLGVILYDPLITDEYVTMHVETRYPPGKSEDVQQITAEYDLPQGAPGDTRIHPHLYLRCNATVKGA